MKTSAETADNHFSKVQQHSNRQDTFFILLLVSIAFLAWVPRFSGMIDLRWDGGVYYVLGTSLAEGKGYRLLNEPGEIEAVQYPPLLPFLIALHQKVSGTEDPVTVGYWLRKSWILIFLAFVPAVYCLARSYLSHVYSLFAAILSCFNFYTLYLSDMATPEILYALCSVLFFLFQRKNEKKTTAVAIVVATSCFYLRTIGIALFAAWILECLFRKKIKNAVLRILLTILVVSPWLIHVQRVENLTGNSKSYYEYQRADYLFYNVSYTRNISLKDPFEPELGKASIGDWIGRWWINLRNIPMSVAETLTVDHDSWYRYYTTWLAGFPIPIPWGLFYVALVILGCLTIVGVLILLSKQNSLLSIYILLYVAGICLAPWPSHRSRYLVPLLPFLVVSLLVLLFKFREVLKRFTGLRMRGFPVLVLSVIFVAQQLTVMNLYRRHLDPVNFESATGKSIDSRWFYYDSPEQSWAEGLRWLRRNAESGTLIACSMPQSVYIRTGLKSVMVPIVKDPSEAQRLL
ncbi:MAG TPA: hypothetical protein VKE92_09265, partial [Anaerolineales bacterium]|nr:hypothetical protein [Anaerolineales bacterium]